MMNNFYRLLYSFANIGFLTLMGTFSSFTYGQTIQQLENRCNANDIIGCETLGFQYEIAGKLRQDKSKAIGPYQKACDGGAPTACFHLALMYSRGDGISQDKLKAATLFQKTCDGSDIHASFALGCVILGSMYEDGDGVSQDSSEALYFFRKACDFKKKDGCEKYKTLKGKSDPNAMY